MVKLFHRALRACILILVLLGSRSFMVESRSTYIYSPLQGIALRRREMELSANKAQVDGPRRNPAKRQDYTPPPGTGTRF